MRRVAVNTVSWPATKRRRLHMFRFILAVLTEYSARFVSQLVLLLLLLVMVVCVCVCMCLSVCLRARVCVCVCVCVCLRSSRHSSCVIHSVICHEVTQLRHCGLGDQN